jgi:hypothetical protein
MKNKSVLRLILASMALSFLTDGVPIKVEGQSSIPELGNVAVVNLGTEFNTTVILKWTGFTGAARSRTIYMSTLPLWGTSSGRSSISHNQ